MIEWKDASSYSKSDTDRTPHTWQVKAGNLRLSVFRHRYYPGKWLLNCNPWFDTTELDGVDIDAAKAEAVERVRASAQEIVDALEGGAQ